MERKVVIHTWTQNVSNQPKSSFWGLGDILRGTCTLYNLSKKYDFDLIVDYSLHPISKFLEADNHPYKDFIEKYKKYIMFINPEQLESFIFNNLKSYKIILLHTNGPHTTFLSQLSDDCKIFVKSLLKPNKSFEEYINNNLVSIPYRSYNILHFRLGDRSILYNNPVNLEKKYYEYDNILDKYVEENDIIISDTLNFKLVTSKVRDIFTFNTTPAHMGFTSDEESVRDTLFEFILASKANKIKTYSTYTWTSGFMTAVNLIYDIPIDVMMNDT